MAKKKKAKPELISGEDLDSQEEVVNASLVFISHDTRDADLASAFAMLLTDASGGILKSFRSSDKIGTSGIEFGAEWYRTIMQKLDDATDVVALLTNRSLNRPWILYETGVAKGKLDSTVFGLALGVSLENAAVGPFAQFQNCSDDEDSITKLVLQLIRRHPDAEPREEAVRRQVQAFKLQIAELLKSRQNQQASDKPKSEESSVAKLFEEIKLQIRDLPEILTAVKQLRAESSTKLSPAADVVGGNPHIRIVAPGSPKRSFDLTVGEKKVRIDLGGTWVTRLSQLGWPDGAEGQALIAEISEWFAQSPDRLRAKGRITLNRGSGNVHPRPYGVYLNQFKPTA